MSIAAHPAAVDIAARLQSHSTVTRRACLSLASTCGIVSPLFVWAQSVTRLPRIALVFNGTPLTEITGTDPVSPLARAFVHGLRDLGYVDGRNLVLERRSTEGQLDRLPGLMKELVGLPVDVIVAVGPAAQDAMHATNTIPIVADSGDPVGEGLTTALARPSRNVTGVADSPGLAIHGKRLQLLKEAAPKSARVAMIDFKYIDSRETPGTHHRRREAEAAAHVLGLTLIAVGADKPEELEQAFAIITDRRADALIEMGNPITFGGRRSIVDFAGRQRMPAIYSSREFVESGGLMSYGVNESDVFGRMAGFVDKILKGAKPADLPWEQPKKLELLINLKAAKAIGLSIPQSLLLRADSVIE